MIQFRGGRENMWRRRGGTLGVARIGVSAEVVYVYSSVGTPPRVFRTISIRSDFINSRVGDVS